MSSESSLPKISYEEAVERLNALSTRKTTVEQLIRTDPGIRAAEERLEKERRHVKAFIREFNSQYDEEVEPLRRLVETYEKAEEERIASGQLRYNLNPTFTLVDRIERPRYEGGSDWSNTRIVLARYGSKELQWVRSGSHWGDMLVGTVSHGFSLMTMDYSRRDGAGPLHKYLLYADDREDRKPVEMQGVRRMSKRVIQFYGPQIDLFFGIPDVAANINHQKTLIITTNVGPDQNLPAEPSVPKEVPGA